MVTIDRDKTLPQIMLICAENNRRKSAAYVRDNFPQIAQIIAEKYHRDFLTLIPFCKEAEIFITKKSIKIPVLLIPGNGLKSSLLCE